MKMKMADMMRKIKFLQAKQRPGSILYNRWLLYALFIVSLANLYTLSVWGHYNYIAVFILVGFITTFFSKNMIVILFLSIAFTNLLKAGMSVRQYEGLETKEGSETESEESKEGSETESEESSKKKKATTTETESNDEKIETKKAELMKDGKELLEVQSKIVDGFQQIEPYMEQAGVLASNIEKSAEYIDKLNK